MGWASTLEDIIERLDDAIHLLSDAEQAATLEEQPARESIQSLIYRAHCLALDLKKLLSIATDPAIDLAQALSDANHRVGHLNANVHDLQRRFDSAIEQRNAALSRADRSENVAREATLEVRRLERVLEGIMKSSPGSIYDAFPPKTDPRT